MATIAPQDLQAKVGEHLGTSEWVLVDQDMINKFADATGDHQFIHIDAEKAKLTPFGGTIAHGFRSEEHTSELQSLMRISYAVFCLKKKKYPNIKTVKIKHHTS